MLSRLSAHMISEETYLIHRTIIYCIVLFFEVFGLFGNINLIVLTLRKKALRTKYGGILLVLTSLHTLCLLYELVDMSFSVAASLYSYQIHRTVCFYVLFPYVFIHSMQTGTVWVLSLDLLITILYPLQYRYFNVTVYYLLIFLLPVIYGLGTVAAGFGNLEDDILSMCNPPSSLPPIVNSKWYYFMMIFSLCTLFFYSCAFFLIYLKAHRHSSDIRFIEKKALETLKFLIIMFLAFRFITVSLASLLLALGVDKDVSILVQNYNIVAGIIAYSQNAYVCFFRSAEYRMLLREQLALLFPRFGKYLNVKQRELTTLRLKSRPVSQVSTWQEEMAVREKKKNKLTMKTIAKVATIS